MLSVEKHCEMLSANVRDRIVAIFDGFKLFVQLFSALVGGAVVLRLQYPKGIPASFVTLSNALAILITVAGMILVWDAFRSWHGHRTKLSEVAGKDEAGNNIIPPPRWHPSSAWLMLWLMPIACVLFYYFNPLR
jgi:hypothetical protein